MRTRIGTHLRYLMAFGEQTGLFEIRSRLDDDMDDKSDTEGKKHFTISEKYPMQKFSSCSALLGK